MNTQSRRTLFAASLTTVVLLSLIALSAAAPQNYPASKVGTWIARDFRFHTGEVMPELRLHYTTVGEPSAEPVLILHGTAQSGAIMLSPAFAGELFGPGQLLDASKYFIILPDAIGHGKSSKPSDGMRAKFPRMFRPTLKERTRTSNSRCLSQPSIFQVTATPRKIAISR